MAIADRTGSAWSERSRSAALVLSGGASDNSIGVQLLDDIRTIFRARDSDKLSSDVIVQELVRIEDRPWPEWGKPPKPMSKNQLARVLNPFEITPGTIRDGEDTCKGYKLEQFNDAFARYLTNGNVTPSQPNTDAGYSQFSERHNGPSVTAENGCKPNIL